jgi:hypothetical protein
VPLSVQISAEGQFVSQLWIEISFNGLNAFKEFLEHVHFTAFFPSHFLKAFSGSTG